MSSKRERPTLRDRLKGTGDLDRDEELSINEIFASLYISDEDLPLKTRVSSPSNTALLKAIGKRIKEEFPELSDFLLKYLLYFLEFNVSAMGKGREEAVKIIASILDKETIRMTIGEKLTSNLAK
ncbi:MAG: hypothetical protein ACFFDH_09505 [Promethearchaeota archaeon]